jgi:hypothetical protein
MERGGRKQGGDGGAAGEHAGIRRRGVFQMIDADGFVLDREGYGGRRRRRIGM